MTPAERLSGRVPTADDIEAIARRTLDRLPSPFADSLGDIVLLIEEVADADTARSVGLRHPMQLSGLYEGVPLNHQSVQQSGHAARADHALSAGRSSPNGSRAGSASTSSSSHIVIHEVGHHFGFSDDDMHALEDERRVTPLLRFEDVALAARRAAAVRRPGSRARAGRSAAGRGAERQRQIEPDPARRRACCAPSAARSSAPRLALADDHLALDRELPLRRALELLGGARLDEAMDALGLAELAEVPVRLLSSGQAKRATLARVAASGAPLWLLDEPLNAPRRRGRRAARRGSSSAHLRDRRRGARGLAPAAARRVAQAGARRNDRRADRARRAPRLDRRRLAADRLLPAGRGAGAVRDRARRAAARRASVRAPCGSPR